MNLLSTLEARFAEWWRKREGGERKNREQGEIGRVKVPKVAQPETVAVEAVAVKRREQRTQGEESGGERGRDITKRM